MLNKSSYFFLLLSVSSGLLGLLGSLGIFISLIIQRRVERLQEILEDLVDQSYLDDINLTSKIYQLINRYQMHYILPDNPSKTITRYIDLTIIVVSTFWLLGSIFLFNPPYKSIHLLLLLPVLTGISILIFFRKLLINAINPLDNIMLNSIIPPPVQLRSVSFLSSYVNVSVKSLLKQARLTVTIEREKKDCEDKEYTDKGVVILKEELSFDDFGYYFTVYNKKECFFIGFGNLVMRFPPDPITKKPAPVERNINVPLGYLNWQALTDEVNASLLIFPIGEKYPIQYDFTLHKKEHYYVPNQDPHCFINQNITYKHSNNNLNILDCKTQLPYLAKVGSNFSLEPVRKYSNKIEKPESIASFLVCNEEINIK
ncbi:MAG: hypothetical protein PWQ96_2370 [Clostridia bacterium]|jgi:hypothetical protein|nr:hypothetical protein [Clostridiales bacterium]MDK2986726.1 hypothetical protein [Clostridia bacterium]